MEINKKENKIQKKYLLNRRMNYGLRWNLLEFSFLFEILSVIFIIIKKTLLSSDRRQICLRVQMMLSLISIWKSSYTLYSIYIYSYSYSKHPLNTRQKCMRIAYRIPTTSHSHVCVFKFHLTTKKHYIFINCIDFWNLFFFFINYCFNIFILCLNRNH